MTYRTQLAARAVLAGGIAAFFAACGGSSPGTGPSTGGTCTAGSTSTTITISNNSVCPQNITVPRGTQVTFVNNDSRTHEMTSDPHPEHTDCPEINQVGFISPGQTKLTGNLNTRRTCGFHDHDQPTSASLQGSIVIK